MSAATTELFNAKLFEFVSDLGTAFPDVQDFKICKSALGMAMNLGPDKPHKIFHQFVVMPYEQHIMVQDEAFFLQQDFREVLADGDFDIVDRIRGVWKRMTDKDKENVWKYLQVLLVLDRKVRGNCV